MNKKITFKIFVVLNLFSATIFTAQRSCFEKINTFVHDYSQKATCTGALTGQTDPKKLREMRNAECLICIGICCCAASGYGTVACVENPLPAYILGSVSGCAGSMALHQAGSLSQKIYNGFTQSPQPYVLPSQMQHTMPEQQFMSITPPAEDAIASRSIRVAHLLQTGSPKTSATENPIACIRLT